jgi:hypothetical protein
MNHGVPSGEVGEWAPASHGTAPLRWLVWPAPVAIAAIVGWIVAGLAGALVAAAVVALALGLWVMAQGRLALRSLGATRLRAHEAPRLFNLVEGFASRAGIAAPSLWLIPSGGPNALVCRAGGSVVAMTRSLLDHYSRTELEAVAAHCVVRLHDSTALSEAAALGRWGSKMAPLVGFAQDAAASALTRYPPALARAIENAEPRSGRYEAMWFVAQGASHDPQSARVGMVQEL